MSQPSQPHEPRGYRVYDEHDFLHGDSPPADTPTPYTAPARPLLGGSSARRLALGAFAGAALAVTLLIVHALHSVPPRSGSAVARVPLSTPPPPRAAVRGRPGVFAAQRDTTPSLSAHARVLAPNAAPDAAPGAETRTGAETSIAAAASASAPSAAAPSAAAPSAAAGTRTAASRSTRPIAVGEPATASATPPVAAGAIEPAATGATETPPATFEFGFER